MSKTVYTVTYQDSQVEALDPDQIRVFEERDTADAYAKLLSKDHDYVRTVSYTHLTLPTICSV